MWSHRAVGQYVAAEASTVVASALYKADGVKRPIIFFTGDTSSDRDFLTTPASGSQIAPRLVDLGVPIVSAVFGGAALWGNDTCQTRIGQAWTYVKAQMGCKADKFIGIGISKGAQALLNYTRNNPSNVAALVGIVPVVNLPNVYADNAGLQAQIDTAYTDHATYLTALPTHDPNANTATHLSQGIPIKLISGTSDATVRPADVASFGAAVGATVQSKSGTDHLTTAPAVDPVEDVLKFIAPYL